MPYCLPQSWKRGLNTPVWLVHAAGAAAGANVLGEAPQLKLGGLQRR